MDVESLFDVDAYLPEIEQDVDDYPIHRGYMRRGHIAEQWAIAECLERGFHVAVPVVDDDGVDLIVNYRNTVQVKSTMAPCWERENRLIWRMNKNPHVRHRNADYFALCWFEARRWWIFPRDVIMRNTRLLTVTIDGRHRAYENAWDLLGGDLDG